MEVPPLLLYSNSISYIQSEAFKDLKKLVILDLSQNILSQIDFTFAMIDIPGTVEGHYLLEVLCLEVTILEPYRITPSKA